ncbi:MAG: DUF5372 family protein, partial [Candidatus Thermoplasmatota archaeon]
HDQTVLITHPCHPCTGQRVAVVHHRPDGPFPHVMVQLPDQSLQCLPVGWTDLASPSVWSLPVSEGARLSAPALLDVVRLLSSWTTGVEPQAGPADDLNR